MIILAVGLALVLGASHAALPGRGKTVLAAYLAGRAGRPRDAVTVGVLVTITHTASVLVDGLLLTVLPRWPANGYSPGSRWSAES